MLRIAQTCCPAHLLLLLGMPLLPRATATSPVLRGPAAARNESQAPLRRPAAAAEEAQPEQVATGPLDTSNTRASQARRQYCWWITFAFPHEETVARLGLKTPADFSRASFMEACVAAHQAANVTLQEGLVFLEKHRRTDTAGQRLPHLNAIDFHTPKAGFKK